jgi:DNA polymerase III epsilon subunit family exonuclease
MQNKSNSLFIAFDLEWTYTKHKIRGIRHHIIEIGAIKFDKNKNIIIDKFDSLLSFDGSIDKVVSELTGIDDLMLSQAPHRSTILLQFYAFIRGATLIAHDVKNDIKVLREEYNRMGLELKNENIDTLTMAKNKFRLDNYNLSFLNDELHLSNLNSFHRAFNDAEVTYLLYKKLKSN